MPDNQRASFTRFPPTIWALVYQAQNDSDIKEKESAFNQLASLYCKPIYAFYRSKGLPFDKSEDLAQSFLAYFIEKQKILTANPARGKFRNFLMTCAHNYMIDTMRKGNPQDNAVVQLEKINPDRISKGDSCADDYSQGAYKDAWRRNVLDLSLSSVCEQCRCEGKGVSYQIFAEYYLADEQSHPTWKEIAGKFRIYDWKKAARMAESVKKKLAAAIRNEIGRYVDNEEELDDEIRDLMTH
jgi:DNA-directed RNA polymerase specialized sigma24 family protein